jgi:hypothetical protein
MHCVVLYEILRKGNTNIFVNLSASQWAESRKVILSVILGTDMSHHFEQISKTQVNVFRFPNFVSFCFVLFRFVSFCFVLFCFVLFCFFLSFTYTRRSAYEFRGLLDWRTPSLHIPSRHITHQPHTTSLIFQLFGDLHGEEMKAYYKGESSEIACLNEDKNRLFVMELVLI